METFIVWPSLWLTVPVIAVVVVCLVAFCLKGIGVSADISALQAKISYSEKVIFGGHLYLLASAAFFAVAAAWLLHTAYDPNSFGFYLCCLAVVACLVVALVFYIDGNQLLVLAEILMVGGTGCCFLRIFFQNLSEWSPFLKLGGCLVVVLFLVFWNKQCWNFQEMNARKGRQCRW